MERIARTCMRLKGWVVLGWVVGVIAVSVIAAAAAGPVSDDFSLPGSESDRAARLLEDAGFAASVGTQAQVVVAANGPITEGGLRDTVQDLVSDVRAAVPAAEVVSPLDAAGRGQVTADGRIGYVAVNLPDDGADALADAGAALADVRDRYDSSPLEVEVGGVTVGQSEGPPTELVGVVAAIVILLLAFGSLVAMGLPILVGLLGAAGGIALVEVGAHVVDMPAFATPVAAMIAIGVGIDYALLVVTRYREAVHGGAAHPDAVLLAQVTAGRSVLFAGLTVVVASAGLVLIGLPVITGVALGVAASVLVTMAAALTLLPALLALTGHRIDRWAIRRRGPAGTDGTLARRWSRQVQRTPVRWAVLSATVLVVLAAPVLDLRLGFSDAGTKPESDTGRRAYDLLAEGFGAGASGPLVLAASSDGPAAAAALERLGERVAADPGVAAVTPPLMSESGDVAVIRVVPTSGPREEATSELVHRLRDDVLPGAVQGSDVQVAVGGTAAAAVDFADYMGQRLPVFLAVILGVALVLLTAVFRALVVAVKAVVVNLISLGAAFGAVVAVFQWGWGLDLLDTGAAGPVEAWAPMMLIAIVFGLSMDYEVFLLSRIREHYDRTGDNATAVSEGLARTARVITAAAAIMVCVFGSFVLGDSRELQLFGFGLAFAVLIDATVVRMVLVPSLMELLGERNWWLPAPLARVLPRLRVEGPATDLEA